MFGQQVDIVSVLMGSLSDKFVIHVHTPLITLVKLIVPNYWYREHHKYVWIIQGLHGIHMDIT